MTTKETNMKVMSVLISIMFLSGCASMFNGGRQLVTIKTDKDTEIFIDDRYAGKGYSKRQLARDETHIIRLQSGTCSQSITTQAKFNKVSLLGLMIDLGLVSLPIDFMSGAAWNIYPNKIKMKVNCTPPTQS